MAGCGRPAYRHITPTDTKHNFAAAHPKSRSNPKHVRTQKTTLSAGRTDWRSTPQIDLHTNEYATL
jgi:hypothetical protein